MTPHIPEEFSTRFDWSPFVITGNQCRLEILMKTKRTRTRTRKKRTAPTNRRSCASRTKTRACTMERFVHNANIEHYRRLIAESEFDQSRDEDRHKMLLTLLAEEVAKDKKPRS